MEFGVMNNPRNDLLEEIKWISKHEFDFIDLTLEPPKALEININKVKRALQYYRLKAIGHTDPFISSIYPIKSLQKSCLNQFKKYIAIFNRLDIKLMTVHPINVIPYSSSQNIISTNIKFLKKVSGFCKTKRIDLMIENTFEAFGKPEIFAKIIMHVPDIKILLDIGHANIGQKCNTTEKFLKLFGNRVMHLHCSDNWGDKDAHLPIGCGNINWKNIINIINKYNFLKTMTLEVFAPDRDYVLVSLEKIKHMLNEKY